MVWYCVCLVLLNLGEGTSPSKSYPSDTCRAIHHTRILRIRALLSGAPCFSLANFSVLMSMPTAEMKLLARLADGVDGLTTFKSRADSHYRFRLDAKDGKLSFWLEDRKSKLQWQTTELQMKDFVQRDSEIPLATFEDYAVCFLNCLESQLPSDEFERDLVPFKTKQDVWELRLTLKLRALMSTWSPTYRFLLEPVLLERVDVLAAKVRDQEEVIETLQAHLQELSLPPNASPVYFRATTAANTTQNRPLVWTRDQPVGGGNLIDKKPNGNVEIKIDGVFVVNTFVQSVNTNGSTAFDLRVNGSVVASCVDSCGSGYQRALSMSYIFNAKKNDTISVQYLGNNYAYAGSSIVIFQLT